MFSSHISHNYIWLYVLQIPEKKLLNKIILGRPLNVYLLMLLLRSNMIMNCICRVELHFQKNQILISLSNPS